MSHHRHHRNHHSHNNIKCLLFQDHVVESRTFQDTIHHLKNMKKQKNPNYLKNRGPTSIWLLPRVTILRGDIFCGQNEHRSRPKKKTTSTDIPYIVYTNRLYIGISFNIRSIYVLTISFISKHNLLF